jgi:competence protein ComEC
VPINRKNIGAAFTLMLLLILCGRVALWYAQAGSTPACLEAGDHLLDVTVNVVKKGPQHSLIMDAQVTAVTQTKCDLLLEQKIRLSWYRFDFEPMVGEQLRVLVRLRAPWGMKNPGGFDYGLWLLGQGYIGAGYIKKAERIRVQPEVRSRYLLIEPGRYVNTNLLNAILLGQRSAVTAAEWSLFRTTGTIHLMVISGLHVGIFVGLVFAVFISLLRWFVSRRLWPAPRFMALIASLVAVALLVLQTGANAPVVRAALMSAIISLTLISLLRVSWWRGLALVAGIAVLMQPRFILQQGFWLSYFAVASLLLYFGPRQPRPSWVSGLLLCQLVLFFGLVPWLGLSAGEIPLISPLANMLVVPVMTLITIPLGMSGVLLQQFPGLDVVAHWCLLVADISLSVVLALLQKLQGTLPSFGYFSRSTAVVAMFGFAVAAMPVGLKLKLLSLFGWLPVLLPNPTGVAKGDFRVIALDVGQGSSAIVDTHKHRLVVDTGAMYLSGFSLGEAVVVPALRSTGPDRVDRLLISHSDNDHAGGVGALRHRYPAAHLLGMGSPCKDGQTWVWDGVKFRTVLDSHGVNTNDRSCTLHVSNFQANVFFSGDIGKRSERRLLKKLPRRVDLLMAPHHGSASSSTPAFVNWLQPKIVVFSAGRNNRYAHPRPGVVTRYENKGAHTYITGLEGAITWHSADPSRASSQR